MAQYTFVDTIEDVPFPALPAEALSIDGTYIEEEIPGYRTLRVSGRELLLRDLETLEVGRRDGAILKGSRFPARVITVEYQLLCDDDNAFREAYITLCNLLNVTDVRCIFADEPDKFFVGTPCNAGDVPMGTNRVVSSFEILCADPFKYSVEEYEVSPDAAAENTFIVDYQGTYRSYPSFDVDFYESDDGYGGACGYVTFINDSEKILLFGNPDEDNIESLKYQKAQNTHEWYDKQQLVNSTFKTVLSDWTKNSGKKWTNQTMTGNFATKEYTANAGKALYPSSYGTGTNLHGPTFLKVIPKDKNGLDEAKSWSMEYHFSFACSGDSNAAKKCRGIQQCLVWNSQTGDIIAGVTFNKNKDGTTGILRLIYNNSTVKEIEVDMSINNAIAGWGRSADKQKKRTALSRAPGMVRITKEEGHVTFTIPVRDGKEYQFIYMNYALKDVIVDRIQFNFLQQGTYAPIEFNGLYYCRFTSNSVWCTDNEFLEDEVLGRVTRENTFNTNDKLTVDTSSAEVYENDIRSPALGALGNDWEEFYLSPGLNQIQCGYSGWVTDEHKPSFKMRYREVFL